MDGPPLSRRQLLVVAGSGAAGLAGCLEGTQTGRQPAETNPENDTPPAGGQSGEEDPPPGDLAVTVTVGTRDRPAFLPDLLRVHPGAIVRWRWQSDGHNVVPARQPDGSEWEGVEALQNAGFVYQHTFEVPGTYEYVCEPHADDGARARLIVLENGIDQQES